MTDAEIQNFIRTEIGRQLRVAFADVIGAPRPDEPTINKVVEAVAKAWNVSVVEIMGYRRRQPVTTARLAAMYLAAEVTPLTISAIARGFRRDHTTILYAIRTMPERMRYDAQLCHQVNDLLERLEA